ncbi:DUF3800 domain-containing protein [Kocuria marina]|uniref:DUF3800 domain-containing protein n=1 Tax=Kocuria marina TaxID=223184 RepID=UPI002989B2C8|nr:DUF3800 domain-containing protein [Kocuria marina]MCT1723068.1 DUF3800 domain-containing protein [Kocuria marina]MCT1734115.1 DUF3800 domain-containing protein [Kocuria marina]
MAYIDESGQRGLSAGSSDHFVLAASVFFENHAPQADALLTLIREHTNRQPGQELHWNKFKAHHKDTASTILADADENPCVRFVAVVACKPHLRRDGTFNQDHAYLLSFRYLLERLSWIARSNNSELHYTLAHIVRFKKSKLREYEARLRALGPSQCKIDWRYVPTGGHINTPANLPYLQLADMTASSIGQAFNVDHRGETDNSHLHKLAPYLYRYNGNLTSYGLKMHPWNDTTKAAYPWVAALNEHRTPYAGIRVPG